ncbi:MAG: phage major capsid protein, partial [Clostridia bacterium]|nr:phage major capsid protein [Clostridia bacterium]
MAMPEYDYAFWNAAKRKPHNANELKKGITNEGGAYLPLQANSKMTTALKRESVFRSLATIAYMRDHGGIILAKHCVEEGCWTSENGMYTFGNSMGEFTEYNIKSHKLGTLLKYDEAYMSDIGLDIENHLIDSIAKSFGAMEDAAYVNGKGDIQPTGILHNTRGAEIGVST